MSSMASDPHNPSLLLGPMLRHVGDSDATIFVETDRPCVVSVLGHHTPTFSVRGHHYALVLVDGLEPATTTPYTVELDGKVAWPEPPDGGVELPPSVIRTSGHDRPVRVLFGSCRTAAPHEPPWTLELATDDRGRGVDALWAHAWRLLDQPAEEWPDLLLLMGDQIYADDTSPMTRDRIERRRADGDDLASDLVMDFEEYCWLYHESWSPRMERWLFSVVPSAMIFDDHDMIDDWNISASWVRDIRKESWWEDHVVGGLMSYWIHQHIGNLSAAEVRADPVYRAVTEAADASEALRDWAVQSERDTPRPGGHPFSFVRNMGRTRIVVLDVRNGRVLEGERRALLDDGEWNWFVEQCHGDIDHLVVVSSLPAFVPGALHDLQVWNESVCAGAWGRPGRRVGEKIRRALDLEDWPAFGKSFDALTDLLEALSSSSDALRSVTLLAGDIHFSYAARILPPGGSSGPAVNQVVCSPLRNALAPQERSVIRFALSRPGRWIGRLLRRSVRRAPSRTRWELDDGPIFANCIGLLTVDDDDASITIEQASVEDERPVLAVVMQRSLTAPGSETLEGSAEATSLV